MELTISIIRLFALVSLVITSMMLIMGAPSILFLMVVINILIIIATKEIDE